MALHVTVHSPHIAMISGITEVDVGKVDAGPVRNASEGLASEVVTVVLAAQTLPPEAIATLVAHGRPLATGRASEDALKRVEGKHVVGSVDRRGVYAAVLPVVANRDFLDGALRSMPNGGVAIADLVVAPGGTIALVDDDGRLIASVPA